MKEVAKRIELLRKEMEANGIDWYFITSDDFHSSEYIADYFNIKSYYSGFTGENAYIVISKNEAKLWTDGRFFISAAIELEGSGIELMKMGEPGVPLVSDYICDCVKEGQTLAFDGRTVSTYLGRKIYDKLSAKDAKVIFKVDFAGNLWETRPNLPDYPIWKLSPEESGESVESKLKRVREFISSNSSKAFFLSKLDDICWLTNLRGGDIAYNPVMLGFMYITLDTAIIFLRDKSVDSQIKEALKSNNIEIRDYDSVWTFLEKDLESTDILIDENYTNFTSYMYICKKCRVNNLRNCTTNFKAVKNPLEIQNLKEIYIKDSVAVTKFMYWLQNTVSTQKISEIDAAQKMDELRAGIEGFVELSFPTISGYGPNAAMMHYEATEEKFSYIEPKGMLLVDSGGQYKKGTTDVTRTFILGYISDEIKCHFSKVAAGMLALADAKFLYGCTGRNLDILARQPLWNIGIDYKCGTGHGIGYVLNVHEGPHNISWRYNANNKETVLEAGMIMSDEPGVYVEGSHGIRTENVILCKKALENSDGQFMEFEHLTFVPIDKRGLDKRYLSEIDIQRINTYHRTVYNVISDYLTEEEKLWLQEETSPI